jgi:restriction endonuclease
MEQKKPMTPSEYEQYITDFVRQFDFCKQAKVSNNRKFQGKRQPGEYEIDIAVEINFSEIIYFLMIFECKYWNRPVDRPVIQSLAQTKDAISAHKAIAVSPNGFSEEARSVAYAHNIALWRIDPDEDEESRKGIRIGFQACLRQPFPIESLYDELRSSLFATIGIDWSKGASKHLFSKQYISTIVENAYTQITNYENWRDVDALKALVEWEDSSIEKLIDFNSIRLEKAPKQLMRNILREVALDNYITFQYLLSHSELSTSNPI